MSKPWARTIRAITVLVLTLVLSLGWAKAAAQQPWKVSIELTSISPSEISAGAEVTITGVVTNTTDEAIRDLRIILWGSSLRINTIARLNEVLASNPGNPSGVAASVNPKSTDLLGKTPLNPGESREFTVSGFFGSELGMKTPGAGYVIGVQAISVWTEVGWARAIIPYPRTEKLLSGAVVMLSAPASWAPQSLNPDEPELFTDESLSEQLRGRLGTLLETAKIPGMTTVIDPLLWDMVSAMATGYQVLQPDGSTREGTGSTVAKAWLKTLREVIASPDTQVFRGLYGTPDLAAAAVLGVDAAATANRAFPSDHELASLELAVFAYPGEFSQQAAEQAVRVNPQLIFTDNPDSATAIQHFRDIPVIHYSADAYAGGPQPESQLPQIQLRLASQRLVYQESGTVLVTAVTTESQAQLVNSGPSTTVLRTAGQLLAEYSPAPEATWKDAASPALPGIGFTGKLAEAQHQLNLWGDLTNNHDAGIELGNQLAAAAWSSAWTDWTAATDWVTKSTGVLDAQYQPGDVQLKLAVEWHLTDAENQVPISIENSKSFPVSVRAVFKSDYPQRITIPASDLVSIEPGQTAQLLITPEVYSNGQVSASVQLETAFGVGLGQPTTLSIAANSAGFVSWLIIIGSGAGFLGLTAARVYQVRRQRGRLSRADPDYGHEDT